MVMCRLLLTVPLEHGPARATDHWHSGGPGLRGPAMYHGESVVRRLRWRPPGGGAVGEDTLHRQHPPAVSLLHHVHTFYILHHRWVIIIIKVFI